MLKQSFPKIITDLPEADIEIKGARGWIAQGKDHQIVFVDIEPSIEELEHSHNFPCWLIMVEGKMELTMNGKSKVYEKDDEVFFPIHVKRPAKFITNADVLPFSVEKVFSNLNPIS